MDSYNNMRDMLTYDEFLFVRHIKEKISSYVFFRFLNLLRDLKCGRLEILVAIQKVKDLFDGHQDLIFSFNYFLPLGFEIELPITEHFHQPFPLIRQVKARFQDDPKTYKSVIEVISKYLFMPSNISEVYQKVSFLLQNLPDLWEAFTKWLPANNIQGLFKDDEVPFVNQVKSKLEENRFSDFLHLFNDFKTKGLDIEVIKKLKKLFEDHPELILSFNYFLPLGFDILPPKITQFDNLKCVFHLMRGIKNHFHADPKTYRTLNETICSHFSKPMNFHHLYKTVGPLLQNHPDLWEDFTTCFPSPDD